MVHTEKLSIYATLKSWKAKGEGGGAEDEVIIYNNCYIYTHKLLTRIEQPKPGFHPAMHRKKFWPTPPPPPPPPPHTQLDETLQTQDILLYAYTCSCRCSNFHSSHLHILETKTDRGRTYLNNTQSKLGSSFNCKRLP